MSPGLQWITQMNLPHTIENPDYKCPVCKRELVITRITQWYSDGRIPVGGMEIECVGVTQHSQEKYSEWETVQKKVYQWFDSFYRYRQATPKEVTKKRRLKWRKR